MFISGPGRTFTGFPAGMGQLNTRYCSLLVDKAGNALEKRNMLILPEAQVKRGNAALRRYSRGFGNNQAGSAHCPAAQVHQVPVVGKAIRTRILAHGGNYHPVLEGKGFYSNRAEKMVHADWSKYQSYMDAFSRFTAERLPKLLLF